MSFGTKAEIASLKEKLAVAQAKLLNAEQHIIALREAKERAEAKVAELYKQIPTYLED